MMQLISGGRTKFVGLIRGEEGHTGKEEVMPTYLKVGMNGLNLKLIFRKYLTIKLV